MRVIKDSVDQEELYFKVKDIVLPVGQVAEVEMSDSSLRSKFTKHHCSLPFKGRLDPLRHIKVNFWKKWYLKAVIVSKVHPLQQYFLQSSGAVAFEKRRHILSRCWYVIHPYSIFAAIWQMIFGCVTFITMCNLPWCQQTVLYYVFGRFILFLDLLNLVNIGCLFFTGYKDDETMEVVLNHGLIIQNYLSGNFYIDILGAFPLLELWQKISNDDLNIRMSILGYFRLLQFRVFFRYSQTTLALFKINEYYMYIFRAFLVSFLIIHTLTCFVSYLVFFVHISNVMYVEDSWVNLPPSTGDETPLSYIILNFTYTFENGKRVLHFIDDTEKDPFRYYTMCNTRVMCLLYPLGAGRSDTKTVEDQYLAIIILLTGRVLCLFMLEQALKFRSWVKSPGVKYYMLMKQVNQYMRRKQLPPILQRKVRLFYEYRFDKRYFEERAILANLSQNLRAEIRNHECRRLVQESVLFRNAPAYVIERILARLKHDVYLPNDVVVRAGQPGDCMFFLVSGSVAVMSRAGDELLHLRDGAFFGELALLSVDERRLATIVAVEVCEVYRLEKEDFQQVVRPMRAMYDLIEEAAQKRMGELLGVEAVYKRLQLGGAAQLPN